MCIQLHLSRTAAANEGNPYCYARSEFHPRAAEEDIFINLCAYMHVRARVCVTTRVFSLMGISHTKVVIGARGNQLLSLGE